MSEFSVNKTRTLRIIEAGLIKQNLTLGGVKRQKWKGTIFMPPGADLINSIIYSQSMTFGVHLVHKVIKTLTGLLLFLFFFTDSRARTTNFGEFSQACKFSWNRPSLTLIVS